MKRAVLIVSGIVLVILGLLLMAAGGAAAALFGSDGSLSTAPARVSGSGVALVVEDLSIDASSIPVPDSLGKLTLSVADSRGRAMFVGSAPSDAVDTYLTGAPYDVVVEVAAGSDARTRAVPGSQQPPPPTTQSFWTRQATGRPAELTARTTSATTLVVMNADATPGVDANLVVTLTVARAWTTAWIAVGVGALLVVLGIVAFWRARVARRRARAAAAAAAPAAPLATAAVAAAPGATILPGSGLESGSASNVDVAPPAAATVASAIPPAAPVEPTMDAEAEPPGPGPTADPTVHAAVDLDATTDLSTDVTADLSTDLSTDLTPDLTPEPNPSAAVMAAAADLPADIPAPVTETVDASAVTPAHVALPDPTADAASDAGDGAGNQADAPEQSAAPVDMASLFAPAVGNDATDVIPVIPVIPEVVDAPDHDAAPVAGEVSAVPVDPDTTGPVAPAETQHPAG